MVVVFTYVFSYGITECELYQINGIMPKKIKELKMLLLKAGCVCDNAKGSHTKWSHRKVADKLILSGKDGADAKPYQEKSVSNYLHEILEEE